MTAKIELISNWIVGLRIQHSRAKLCFDELLKQTIERRLSNKHVWKAVSTQKWQLTIHRIDGMLAKLSSFR